jgi:L-rhamnose mutarotase
MKQRFCLTLELKDNLRLITEYEHWHKSENIWPEIPAGIKEVGIQSMEIFRLGIRLFMIIEAGSEFDFERDMAKLATLPRQQEWEAFVSRFQKSAPGKTSSEKWKLMEKIFELDPRSSESVNR